MRQGIMLNLPVSNKNHKTIQLLTQASHRIFR